MDPWHHVQRSRTYNNLFFYMIEQLMIGIVDYPAAIVIIIFQYCTTS